MKKYFIIILILTGVNFVVFGVNTPPNKQSGKSIEKIKIRELQSKVDDTLQKEDNSNLIWFSFLGPLLGVILGGGITFFIQRCKNKSDEKLKSLELLHNEQQKVQAWFEKEIIDNLLECMSYYGALRIIISNDDRERLIELKEPLSALIRLIHFTGIKANIVSFSVVLHHELEQLEKLKKSKKSEDNALSKQTEISFKLKNMCNCLHALYISLLRQTIQKKTDIESLKDNGCRNEIETLNKFIYESFPDN